MNEESFVICVRVPWPRGSWEAWVVTHDFCKMCEELNVDVIENGM